ncbi:MAG: hypothetical protein A3I08_01105 [Candidatus Andersenbacteria bacterium RIFCSPLOWO2_02_FULL_46_11]|nr:MAG: hypothetical protein A3I08_01105 [Candidatus Andersenbacteria bacterium RIFCSPLOWO2_02_FULL_46_11]
MYVPGTYKGLIRGTEAVAWGAIVVWIELVNIGGAGVIDISSCRAGGKVSTVIGINGAINYGWLGANLDQGRILSGIYFDVYFVTNGLVTVDLLLNFNFD